MTESGPNNATTMATLLMDATCMGELRLAGLVETIMLPSDKLQWLPRLRSHGLDRSVSKQELINPHGDYFSETTTVALQAMVGLVMKML